MSFLFQKTIGKEGLFFVQDVSFTYHAFLYLNIASSDRQYIGFFMWAEAEYYFLLVV